MAVREAPSWLQNGSHSAEDDRLLLASIFGGSPNQTVAGGVVAAADLKVTQTPTASMNLNVASGAAFIVGTETTTQGIYNLVNDAQATVTISTANATNPRIDLVVAQVLDDQYSGASHLGQLVVVTGVAAPSPSPPAVPKNSLVLAQIAVGAGVMSITTANITDQRVVFGPANKASWVASGHLAADYDITTGLATFLTTASLAPGTWLVNATFLINQGSSTDDIEITTTQGTATATFEGAYSANLVNTPASARVTLGVSFIATVTAAGTLTFKVVASATTSTPQIQSKTATGTYTNATGYTALRIF